MTADHPALAAVKCTAADAAVEARYTLFPDAASMNAAYATVSAQAQIEPDSGSCFTVAADGTVNATSDSWPSENAYDIDGAPVGRYVCQVLGDQPTVTWTDTRLNILGQASAASGDEDRLVTFWYLDSGPKL